MSSIQSVKRAFQRLYTVAQFPSEVSLGGISDTSLRKVTQATIYGKLVAALSLYGPVFRVPTCANEKEYSDLVVKVVTDMTVKLAGPNHETYTSTN